MAYLSVLSSIVVRLSQAQAVVLPSPTDQFVNVWLISPVSLTSGHILVCLDEKQKQVSEIILCLLISLSKYSHSLTGVCSEESKLGFHSFGSVSYTHLTLPTSD